MQNTLSKQQNTRNASIDIFRFICAIMVVAIHTHPFQEVTPPILHTIFSIILPRIAVPFFLCTSGYFYINKLLSGKKVFFPYIKKLLTVYCSWSLIYLIVRFFRNVIYGNMGVVSFIKDFAFTFFIEGSEYHFWFFPALIISVCIVTLFYKLKLFKTLLPLSFVLYAIGCLGCSYYKFGSKIPLLSDLYSFSDFTDIRRICLFALPFFMCGYLISVIKEKFVLKNKPLFVFTSISLALHFTEILLVTKFEVQREVVMGAALYPLLLFTMLLLLNNPLPKIERISGKSKIIADFTYYSHPVVIIFIRYLSWKVFDGTITQTVLFLITVILTFLLGLLCCNLKKTNIIRKIFF